MQQLTVGDFVVIKEEDWHYYFLVLTSSAFFGCQWTRAFHLRTRNIQEAAVVMTSASQGFTALIDFIEYRRNNSVLKLGIKQDVSPFLKFEFTRTRIDEPNGSSQWYIYNRDWKIVEKKKSLEQKQRAYPIGSGMGIKKAFHLIANGYTNDHIQTAHGTPQFPFQ